MIQTTDAVILRSERFRETSRLLTFLTPDFGKIHTLAKGVRRQPSRFGSTFQLFTCNRIVFYERKRSGLQLLSQCDLINPFSPIRSDLKRTACAVYFTELVDRATEPADPNGRLYALLLRALRDLSEKEDLREIVPLFEVKLLSLSGLMPELTRCQGCREKITAPCALSLQKGGILCDLCSKKEKGLLQLSMGILESIRHMASSPWELAHRIRIPEKNRGELTQMLRQFIAFYLDEKIRSRRFLEEVESL
ncbi:MAG: DNA repair protein RecO [Candidatus Omnitrophica bacterium]|nr:DNA repair protein RecO [Candidatus Omnitrophota bacterium]